MKSVHLVIPDLFLPADIAAEVCADLRLPALEKLLGRGIAIPLSHLSTSSERTVDSGVSTSSGRTDVSGASLENLLCELFGVPCAADAPIAPISAAFDGLGAGCWLRADPVHLHLQRDRLLLADVLPGREEAVAMCASLNVHFAGQGMEFFAPHPQRWYVRLDALPRISTTPLSQVIGCNVRGALPTGVDASRWHQVFNETQMLLFAHPLNAAREARGELPINSVWLWGGGCSDKVALHKNYDDVSSDDVLANMFAAAAGVPFSVWPENWQGSLSLTLPQKGRGYSSVGKQLLAWTGLRSALQRGDMAAWRTALQDFESGYAQPLWQALRSGKIVQLQLDILGGDSIRRVRLKRGDAWAFWRRAKRLAEYLLV